MYGYDPYRRRRPIFLGQMKHTGDSIGWTANRAYQTLVETADGIVVNRVGCKVTAQAGNIDGGIYAADGSGSPLGVASTRLVSTGSIACPAVGYAELVVPDTLIPAGWFWIVLATDSTSTGFAYLNTTTLIFPGSGTASSGGHYVTDSAFPLPATMGAPSATGSMPCMWVRYVP